MHAVGDELRRDHVGLQGGTQQPRLSVMEGAHGVEGVGQVPRPGSERLPRRFVTGIAVAESDDAAGGDRLLQNSAGAGQLRRHGEHTQMASRRIHEPAEQIHVGCPQPGLGESAAMDWIDKRPLKMDADEPGAVGHRPSLGGGTHAHLTLVGRVRHDAGEE